MQCVNALKKCFVSFSVNVCQGRGNWYMNNFPSGDVGLRLHIYAEWQLVTVSHCMLALGYHRFC